jgi:hypothetical protein
VLQVQVRVIAFTILHPTDEQVQTSSRWTVTVMNHVAAVYAGADLADSRCVTSFLSVCVQTLTVCIAPFLPFIFESFVFSYSAFDLFRSMCKEIRSGRRWQ